MNIVLTTWSLADISGISTFTMDLASALHRAGHRVAVCTSLGGPVAKAIHTQGISVIGDLQHLPFTPDIIHGQNQPMLVRALLHFRNVPVVAVTHDATSKIDEPFFSSRIAAYVAVDERCRKRLEAVPSIPRDKIHVILNAVDLGRFRPRPPLPRRPERALVFSNYANMRTHLPHVLGACEKLGLAVDVIGSGVRNQIGTPEKVLGQYDLVFAKARCAMEALVTGTAVVLCDFSGLGPMVSTANYATLRPWNFGAGVMTKQPSVEAIVEEVLKYDRDDSAIVSNLMRADAGMETALGQWLALYQTVLQRPRDISDDAKDRDLLDNLDQNWRTFHALTPMASAVKFVQNIPVIGPALYTAATRIWHKRY